ncbi:MAG: flavin reductase family protein [Rhodospirillales bacterium]|jgi:flavin reductase (DIM6/NTAB) family NADH-FMN oxidoreductase RutF|tara:strand:+ start:423 stop:1067 length:645 start_codon:yes stop_codon:yes gene_type:complete
MEFDFSKLTSKDRYKLLSSTVIPRPIALVSTIDENGVLNAAPYSFFNMFAEEPATCVLGIQKRPDGKYKDTSSLIRKSGEYVINLVDMDLAESMNISSINFDPEYDEFDLAGFTPVASRLIAPPRIKEAPVSFECRRTVTLQLNEERDLVVGEVLTMHARDGLIDPETLYLDREKYDVVGRLYADLYAPLREVFSLKSSTQEEWLEKHNKKVGD